MTRPLLASVFLGSLLGCNSGGDGSTREVALVDLACASLDVATGSWESAKLPEESTCETAGSCCSWIELRGNTKLRVEHGLGRRPRSFGSFLSFSETGVGSTPAAGDALRLLSADDTHVVLENNTDQRFYVRFDLR